MDHELYSPSCQHIADGRASINVFLPGRRIYELEQASRHRRTPGAFKCEMRIDRLWGEGVVVSPLDEGFIKVEYPIGQDRDWLNSRHVVW